MTKVIESNSELTKLSVKAKELYDLALSRYIEKYAKNVDIPDEFLDEKEKREYEEIQRKISNILLKKQQEGVKGHE